LNAAVPWLEKQLGADAVAQRPHRPGPDVPAMLQNATKKE
jgi:hypothetical protein